MVASLQDNEVPLEVQVSLLRQELQLWVNTQFVWTNRLQAHVRLEKLGLTDADDKQTFKTELEKCQAQISFYEERLQALAKQTDPDLT